MNEGKKITDLQQLESIPKGTSYLAEAGDGSGTRSIKHETLVSEMEKALPIGDMEELAGLERLEAADVQDEPATKGKLTLTKAILKVFVAATAIFKGTDGIKAGTAGMVPIPKPEDEGKFLNANGKWEIPSGGGGGSLKVLKSIEELEANTEEGYLVDALVVKEILGRLAGCWFRFETSEGEPKDEPYVHWMAEEED